MMPSTNDRTPTKEPETPRPSSPPAVRIMLAASTTITSSAGHSVSAPTPHQILHSPRPLIGYTPPPTSPLCAQNANSNIELQQQQVMSMDGETVQSKNSSNLYILKKTHSFWEFNQLF